VTHHKATDDIRAVAASYVLGSLDAADARRLEEHVEAGCAVCRVEVEGFAAVADDLALAVTPVAPPASVRTRLFADLSAERDRGSQLSPSPALAFLLADEGGWQEVAPGVSRRELGSDGTTRSRSFLIRMTPGATIAPHGNTVAEHCYVLDGDVEVAGRRLHPGDYHLAPPGSLHESLGTEGGCVFLIVECPP
jgi:putative transcriptional regulator